MQFCSGMGYGAFPSAFSSSPEWLRHFPARLSACAGLPRDVTRQLAHSKYHLGLRYVVGDDSPPAPALAHLTGVGRGRKSHPPVRRPHSPLPREPLPAAACIRLPDPSGPTIAPGGRLILIRLWESTATKIPQQQACVRCVTHHVRWQTDTSSYCKDGEQADRVDRWRERRSQISRKIDL